MDETHTILKKPNSQEFIDHQNLVDEDIKWTTEGEVVTHIPKKVGGGSTRGERVLSFLDDWTVVGPYRSISTAIQKRTPHW